MDRLPPVSPVLERATLTSLGSAHHSSTRAPKQYRSAPQPVVALTRKGNADRSRRSFDLSGSPDAQPARYAEDTALKQGIGKYSRWVVVRASLHERCGWRRGAVAGCGFRSRRTAPSPPAPFPRSFPAWQGKGERFPKVASSPLPPGTRSPGLKDGSRLKPAATGVRRVGCGRPMAKWSACSLLLHPLR